MLLVLLALAWLAGIASVALWASPPWLIAAAFLAAAPAVLAFIGRRPALVALAMAGLSLVGAFRFDQWNDRPVPSLVALVGREVTLEGNVSSEPLPGRTVARYRVDIDGRDDGLEGGVLISVGQYARYEYGDRVRLKGELEAAPTFPDFDYRAYLARQGIVGTMFRPRIEMLDEASGFGPRRNLTSFRLELEDSLERSLPEPQASLAAGIAFGRDGNLPDDLHDDFRRTGLAHIVAVSGSNVAFATGLVFVLLTPLVGRRLALYPAALSMLAYVTLAGFSASVLRAGIMAAIFLIGLRFGRQRSALSALGAAAILMTLAQPQAATEIGFQLSFAATAGLIAFAPWIGWAIEAALARARVQRFAPRWVINVFALTLAATVATLPLTWVNFGQVSVVGPLANVIVEPLFIIAFAGSIVTALLGLAWDPAGWSVGLVAYYPLAAITWTARALSALPFAAISVPRAGGNVALLAYLALGALAWPAYRYRPSERNEPEPRPLPSAVRWMAWAAATAVALAIVARISLLPLRDPGELTVTVLDVGQGDAILITTPRGHQTLVDGGPSGIEVVRELGAALPHWDRTLDRIVLTHPDEDHIAGLVEVLRRFEVGTIQTTGVTKEGDTYRRFLVEGEGDRGVLRAGAIWEEDGVRFEVVWPPPSFDSEATNETSLILLITYGEIAILLTGDIQGPPLDTLGRDPRLRAQILKVPHHGSKTTPTEFFGVVRPTLAVISAGAGNPFGHPAPETLAALDGSRVLRTDTQGRITLRIDGRSIEFETER